MRKNTDANQGRIVRALRDVGATVTVLSQVGYGCPDILVGFRGVNYLLEIKDGAKSPSRQRLTPAEMRWHNEWRGQVAIVNSIDAAIDEIQGDL